MKNLLLGKTFRMLEYIADSPVPVTLKELQLKLGINSASASRIAADLAEAGLVEKIGYRCFAPAPGLIRLGQAAWERSRLTRIVLPLLQQCAKKNDAFAVLAGCFSGRPVYLYHAPECPQTVLSPLASGIAAVLFCHSLPAGEGKGKLPAFCAGFTEMERELFRAECAEAAERKVLVRRDSRGFWCIAYPLTLSGGSYALALCGGSAAERSMERLLFEGSLLLSRIRSALNADTQGGHDVEKM